MSESRNHIELVKVAYHFIKGFVLQDKQSLIQIDSTSSDRPMTINGRVIPDIQYWDGDLYIIGEAKTINDFDNKHSKMQYDVYLKECEDFQGKAILVVAVPWQIVNTAKNYFRRKKKNLGADFDIIIINEMGVWFSV